MQNIRIKLLAISILILSTLKVSAQENKLKVDLGGMLRFAYNSSSWKNTQQARGGDFAIDCLGLTARADYDNLYLNFDYRFNSKDFGGAFLRYGYFGYKFNENNDLKLGLVPVAFGNSDFNSNNFFFSINYYSGFEADNDMGISYTKTIGNLKLDMAFMKNGEDLNMSNKADETYDRYAYDVTSILDENENAIYRNKEINQLNTRVIYSFTSNQLKSNIGASVMYGKLFNIDTEKLGYRYAWAIHYNADFGNFNFKAQAVSFKYNAKNPNYQNNNIIAMAAYGNPYFVASQSVNYTASLAYKAIVKSSIFNSFTFYNDFGIMDKKDSNFENTIMNVTGVMILAGPVYTYIDWAMGKNHAWLGPDWTNAFAQGNSTAKWNYRFNVNIGFYF